MSQVYGENGNVIPVTVVEVEPNTVVQIKGRDKDGYEAIQIGYGTRKAKNIKSMNLEIKCQLFTHKALV